MSVCLPACLHGCVCSCPPKPRRSYRSVINFYASLTELLKGPRSKGSNLYLGKDLLIPGLSLLPDALQQQHRQGRSPGDIASLVNKALIAAGRSFVREGGAAAAAAAGGGLYDERGVSPGSSDGQGAYPAGGAKAAAANAAAVAARQWQPPPLVANLPPPRKGSPVLVSWYTSVGVWGSVWGSVWRLVLPCVALGRPACVSRHASMS